MKTIDLDSDTNFSPPKESREKPERKGLFKRRKDRPKKIKIKKPLTKKQKIRRWIMTFALLLILCGGGYYVLRMLGIISGSGIDLNPWNTVRNLIAKEEPELKKDDQGRTNSLIVGIDTRPDSPGLQNTDTIIVASYNHKTKNTVLISIPRDTWAAHPDNDAYHLKINGIYNVCENEEEGTGLECLKESAETITNLDIQYYAMLDISGLVKVVDILGGVEVNVERSFTDYMFPSSDGGYEIASFEKGLQTMDGEEAMKYARSRHAQGPEGSDFARARRQQRLIVAIVKKILTIETYANPIKMLELAEQIGDNLQFSDVNTEDMRAAWNIAGDIDEEKIYSEVLDPSIGNWTIIGEDPSDAYILYPKLGIDQFDDLHEYISLYLSYPGMYSEEASIYVYDGGYGYNESYEKTTELLEKYPYTNFTFGGTITRNYTGVTLASFGDEQKLNTLSQLEKYFKVSYSSEETEELSARYGENIMIILGVEETAENISQE